MNCCWKLIHACRGYAKGSRWTLIRIERDGWYMENDLGGRVLWGNPDLFEAA